MRALVTGGAGFIGSNLVDALIAAGHEVTVIDNFSTGKRDQVHKGAKLVEADIRNLDDIAPHFSGKDAVFHLAALARIQPSIQDPRSSHDVNVTGTLNVLLAARDAGVTRVVYSASSSAYGPQNVMPLVETMASNPQNPYAMNKYFGEVICRVFADLYGLQTVSLRYFNVYGPRQTTEGAYATAIGIFLRQRKAGEPLTIVPDGAQRRDFTNVRDVVRANILAADALVNGKVGKGDVINIGTGVNHAVLDVAALIGGPTIFLPPRKGEVQETRADNRKAKELLGWTPEVVFSDGIRQLQEIHGLL